VQVNLKTSSKGNIMKKLGIFLLSLFLTGSTFSSEKVEWENIIAFEKYTSPVYSVAFSSDSTQIPSGSSYGAIKLWDVVIGKLIHTFNGDTDASRLSSAGFSSDGTKVVLGFENGTIKLWALTK